MNKKIALCLALSAATSCKPEAVRLGVKEHDDKAKAQEASQNSELIVLQRASGPPTTHDTPSAPVAQQNVATLQRKGGAIEEKVDINAKDNKGYTPLLTAAKAGNTAKVCALIDKGANIEANDKDDWKPLHFAAINGHKDVAALLLDNKADREANDNRGWTPLHFAAYNGHEDVEALLLAKGANIEANDNLGKTPIHTAAPLKRATKAPLSDTKAAIQQAFEQIEQGDRTIQELNEALTKKEEIIQTLTNEQAALRRAGEERDKNIQALKEELANVQNMRYNAQTALQSAARQGDIAKLKELLNKPGIDVDTLNTIGKTPLHYAKDAATVQLLLAHGATVHALDNNEHTPLYEAALAGRHDAVLALLKAGANAQEALQRAAKDGYTRALQALLNAGADARGVLYEAVQHKQIIAVQTLLKAGVNAQAILQRAAREEDVILLKVFINAGNAVEEKEGQPPWPAYAKAALELIEKKVDINAKDDNGYTPLHRAAEAGNTAKVWALIANGAKATVNAKANNGWTPLHWAAYNGNTAVATLLLANGAKATVNAKNNIGETPLHWAALNGHAAVATLLIDNKADINAKTTGLLLAGYTPLHRAAQNGHKDVATLLIAKGAYVNAKNNDGKTPLGEAKESWRRNKEAMKALLREHGGHE